MLIIFTGSHCFQDRTTHWLAYDRYYSPCNISITDQHDDDDDDDGVTQFGMIW